jgi:hypothetical protein
MHIVASVFFLNQPAPTGEDLTPRKFTTLAEYANLRDHFLNAYTTCVHAPYATPTKPKTTPAKRRR